VLFTTSYLMVALEGGRDIGEAALLHDAYEAPLHRRA
jgi:hypothetical protein